MYGLPTAAAPPPKARGSKLLRTHGRPRARQAADLEHCKFSQRLPLCVQRDDPRNSRQRLMRSALWLSLYVTLVTCSAALVASVPSTQRAATELSSFGLTVVSQPHLDGVQLQSLRRHSTARLDALLAEISVAGVDPVAQDYDFAEISHRQKHRWDLRLPDGDELWASACDVAAAAAMPIFERLHPPGAASCAPRRLMTGVLISRPGAAAQRWHVDCDSNHLKQAAADAHCRIYNVFMPLVELGRDDDGTQFWPGSHAAPLHDGSLPPPTCPPVGATVAPPCPAGGLVVADYRTMHRGLANRGRERAIAYVVVGVGREAHDNSNFSPVAIQDTHPRVLEQLEYWDDEEAA